MLIKLLVKTNGLIFVEQEKHMIITNKIKLKIIVINCFIFSVISCHISSKTQDSSTTSAFDSQNLNTEILKYKTWTLVNAEPQKMAPDVAAACADVRKEIIVNPHEDKYIRVYVNEFGREAMFKKDNPKFPVGSMIVKEKLPSENSEVPEFYTIMVKRESGFDTANGDWQYLTMDKTKSKIVESRAADNRVSCQFCHITYKDTSDYVSREYLPFSEHEY